MKVLFDANTQRRCVLLAWTRCGQRRELGWQGLENGDLLDAADRAGFDLLLTCDENIQYQ